MSSRRYPSAILILALMITCTSPLVGCQEDEDKAAEVEQFEVLMERPITAQSTAPAQDINALVQANTSFALDLWRELRAQGSGNMISSPFSISRAFSGYYKPAGPEQEAFKEVFHFLPDPAANAKAMEALSAQLILRPQDELTAEQRSAFESSDIYWVHDEDADASAPVDRVHRLNIQDDPEAARKIINDWISRRSYGLLQDFLGQGSINRNTTAVMTNVVFFLGRWAQRFKKVDDMDFTDEQGKRSKVTAFGIEEQLRVATDDEQTILRLSYNGQYSMLLLMPTASSSLEALSMSLDEAKLKELSSLPQSQLVRLKMPSINTNSEPDIVSAINRRREATQTTGGTLTGAFMEAYVHKAVITVNEEGAKAAAATAIIEYNNNAPDPTEPLVVNIDRPFVYFILDDQTGTILFMGQYTSP